VPIYLPDDYAQDSTTRTIARWTLGPLLRRLFRSPPETPTPAPAARDLDRTLSLERCYRCMYSRGVDGMFECHRRPPQLVYDDETRALTSTWPNVDEDEWCGDFHGR
jgi:hypothetical protein